MSTPTTGMGLVLLLIFVIPGAVFGLVFERVTGPLPGNEFGLRVLRAITWSTGFHCVYLLIFASAVLEKYHEIDVAFRSDRKKAIDGALADLQYYVVVLLGLMLVVPVIVGLVVGLFTRTATANEYKSDLLWKASPAAWDVAFANREHAWVRIQLENGEWIGGKWVGGSTASASPDEPELFLSQAVQMLPSGQFGQVRANSRGVWVKCANARRVELYR